MPSLHGQVFLLQNNKNKTFSRKTVKFLKHILIWPRLGKSWEKQTKEVSLQPMVNLSLYNWCVLQILKTTQKCKSERSNMASQVAQW